MEDGEREVGKVLWGRRNLSKEVARRPSEGVKPRLTGRGLYGGEREHRRSKNKIKRPSFRTVDCIVYN